MYPRGCYRNSSGQMTSYAVTQRRCRPCDDVTYPVTPSLLGRKIVLGRRRCRARPGRAGTWVSTLRPLRIQLQEHRLRRRSGSRPIRLISLEISRPGPIRGGLMICGSRCLPHVPPRVLPKFVDPCVACGVRPLGPVVRRPPTHLLLPRAGSLQSTQR